MTLVKINCRGTSDIDKKLKLLEIIFSHKIHIARCLFANDGFVALPNSEAYKYRIFSREVRDKIVQYQFSPVMSAEPRVKKSDSLTRMDNVIYDWA